MFNEASICKARSYNLSQLKSHRFGLSKFFISITALAAVAGLSGCGGGSSDAVVPAVNVATGSSYQVNYFIAPVEQGTCSLLNATGEKLVADAITKKGVGQFNGVPANVGMLKVSCSGGTYTDQSTGATMIAPPLRSYLDTASGNNMVNVNPLTEIAVNMLGTGSAIRFTTMMEYTAEAFGIPDINLNKVTPTDINTTVSINNEAGQYGTVIASFSEAVKAGHIGNTAALVISKLANNFDAFGNIKDNDIHEYFQDALDDMYDNPRLQTNIGPDGLQIFQDIFDAIAGEEPLATVSYINTDFSLTRTELSQTIAPNAKSIINIVGEHLYLDLKVTLGGQTCKLRDLESLQSGESAISEIDYEEMFADCPAVAAGKTDLVIMDGDIKVNSFNMQVQTIEKPRVMAPPRMVYQNGSAVVKGTVTADAPSVDITSGAHDYGNVRNFKVKGVVVELLDAGSANAVLQTSSTDNNGAYLFSGVAEGTNAIVRVKAQLFSNAAAKWDISVRDNTSNSSPKALYTLDSAPNIVGSTETTINLNAKHGFNADGSVATASGGRQSAPFSILELMYTAVVNLKAANPNVELPAVNVYWSENNIGTSGDKNTGQIGTSHYADSGTLPGLYILGKADVDTDEFDQGVIGHEFGHYLQAQLSFSDNPGGSHSYNEFKDASLAYGEGYGTAIGGLLAGSPYYVDTSGVKQSSGGVTNLDAPTISDNRKGFYSEESVAYVMYQMGKRNGFIPLWNAIVAMKSGHESATIFNLLAKYFSVNNGSLVSIDDLLTQENIKSKSALGTTSSTDAAINKEASKGATDLEIIYIPVTMTTPSFVGTAAKASDDSQGFCFNRNLRGANSGNGLGMRKRFTFTATFTGDLGLKFINDAKKVLPSDDYSVMGRDSTGQKLSMYNWADGTNQIEVVQGRTYTIMMGPQDAANVFNGNRCGNTVSLWRLN